MNKVNRNRKNFFSVLIGTLLVMCLFGCGKDSAYYVDAENIAQETQIVSSQEQKEERNPSEAVMIYIYVCGEVQNPGVYEMPEGSRVYDVFAKAGGLTEKASPNYWNQAKLLVDGEMIYVPTLEEAEERKQSSLNVEDTLSQKVNINVASKEQLMTIPGIGEAKALAIIAYREKNGMFSKIEDVMNVEGIKDGMFAKMKEYIVVN